MGAWHHLIENIKHPYSKNLFTDFHTLVHLCHFLCHPILSPMAALVLIASQEKHALSGFL
jgi:hypothetical protein